jgi:epoxyqueuosine reductase
MEKAWAQAGGLGWIGKHSNLVSTQFGSWLLLGELLTTAPLAPDAPGTDLCGTCALCIRACPTGAISEPYVVDAGRCISYVTIELRGEGHEIAPHLAGQMGNRIFGCDDCLDACPYNMAATPTAAPAFQPRPLSLAPRLEDLARIDARDFNRLFHRSPIRRPKLGGFLRSVRIALANLARTASSRPEARLTG